LRRSQRETISVHKLHQPVSGLPEARSSFISPVLFRKWITRKNVNSDSFPSVTLGPANKSDLPGSSNANEAVEISIVQAGERSPATISSFNPQFTYPIFGEEERIFGYQGLRISIRFAAHDLKPNVRITYDKKFETVGDTHATDIEEILRDWIPACESPFTG
jgi:hypothetical protein